MNTEVTKKKDYKLEDFAAEDAMITDFFRRNADKMPDVDLEFQRFKQQHIRPKTFSLTAIIAASAVAALLIAFLFYGSLSSTKVSKEPLVAYTADKNQRTAELGNHGEHGASGCLQKSLEGNLEEETKAEAADDG